MITNINYDSFMPLRSYLAQCFLGRKSKNLFIRPGVKIMDFKNLHVGDNVSINDDCFFSCNGGLHIGNEVSIAHKVSIITTEHSYSDPNIPIRNQPIKKLKVIIGSNVWIGANVTVLAGVKIPNGTIVAAGAVVNKSFTEPNTIIAGVPARKVKNRF